MEQIFTLKRIEIECIDFHDQKITMQLELQEKRRHS